MGLRSLFLSLTYGRASLGLWSSNLKMGLRSLFLSPGGTCETSSCCRRFPHETVGLRSLFLSLPPLLAAKIQLLSDAQNCRPDSPNSVLYFKLTLQLEVKASTWSLNFKLKHKLLFRSINLNFVVKVKVQLGYLFIQIRCLFIWFNSNCPTSSPPSPPSVSPTFGHSISRSSSESEGQSFACDIGSDYSPSDDPDDDDNDDDDGGNDSVWEDRIFKE